MKCQTCDGGGWNCDDCGGSGLIAEHWHCPTCGADFTAVVEHDSMGISFCPACGNDGVIDPDGNRE
jgi:hypothetical protein